MISLPYGGKVESRVIAKKAVPFFKNGTAFLCSVYYLCLARYAQSPRRIWGSQVTDSGTKQRIIMAKIWIKTKGIIPLYISMVSTSGGATPFK